jgi:hypothetical protein
MMFTSIFSRTVAARLAIGGMVLAAVTVSGPTASADSGPVPAQSYNYTRPAVGNTVLFRTGEAGQVNSNAYLSDEYSGWPVANNTVFTRTAFSLKNLPTAMLPDYPLEVFRSWGGTNFDDEQCQGVDDYGNTLTVTSTTFCINNLSMSDTYYLENNSAQNQTVNTNFSSQVVKVGKKGKKAKAITGSNGLTTSLNGYFNVYNEESVSVMTGDRDLSANFEMCIDESLVDDADLLTIEYDMKHDSVSLPSTDYVVYESGSDYGTWDMTDKSALTFEITEVPAENLILDFSLYLQDDEYVDATEPGTYEGTVDVKLNGTSVTEPCPTYNSANWPTSLDEVNGVAGSAELTTTQRSAPDLLVSNDNFDQYSSRSDGFGGMFYWAYPGETWEDNPNSDVRVVHMTASAPSVNLAGIGQIPLNTGDYGYFEIARFGVDGQNWFTLVPGNRGTYAFKSGSMTLSAGADEANFTARTLNGLCGRGFTAGYVAPIPAATVNPLLEVYCNNGAISKSVLAKVVSGRTSVVATLGTGTRTRPCVSATYGTDTRASGSEAAVIFYTRVSSKDSNGNCGSNGATISARSINSVPANLIVIPSAVNITSNPWTPRDEPAFISIAAGTASGTWFGISSEMSGPSYYSPSVPAQLFTMTASGIQIRSNDITLDESTNFGEWVSVSPLSQVSQDPATEWSLMITGSAEFDGEGIGRATVATISEDGVITNGDILEMRGMGYGSSRIIGYFSADSDGNATMYTVNSETTYMASVWDYTPE